MWWQLFAVSALIDMITVTSPSFPGCQPENWRFWEEDRLLGCWWWERHLAVRRCSNKFFLAAIAVKVKRTDQLWCGREKKNNLNLYVTILLQLIFHWHCCYVLHICIPMVHSIYFNKAQGVVTDILVISDYNRCLKGWSLIFLSSPTITDVLRGGHWYSCNLWL